MPYREVYGEPLQLSHLIVGQAITGAADGRLPLLNPACSQDIMAWLPGPLNTQQQQQLQQLHLSGSATAAERRQQLEQTLKPWLTSQSLALARLRGRESGLPLAQAQHEQEILLQWLQSIPTTLAAGTAPSTHWLNSQHSALISTFEALLKALMAGCPVIWQPDISHAASAFVLSEALQKGLPAGMLNLVYPTAKLTDHLSWQHPPLVTADHIRLRLTPAESLPVAVPRIVRGVCSSLPGERLQAVEVPARRLPELLQRLQKSFQSLRTGDPILSDRLDYGPLAREADLKTYLAFFEALKKGHGGQLHYGKGRMSRNSKIPDFIGDPDLGHYVWPLLWQPDSAEAPLPELPGPVLALIPV
ncbi:MAG: aldehyde dehydrogenase family protein [Candidatus Sericytochromatia bacterium]|nr:aldehyde dehydrogenase family protein [Candidatus Sericytochromatia bacterium]